eukprot:g10422.t1
MLLDNINFGENVVVTKDEIRATYQYDSTEILKIGNEFSVVPKSETYEFVTDKKVPKMGVMLVGWGGNNGSTVTAGILANKNNITWKTKRGLQKPNYYGSLTQASTVRVGNYQGEECFVPFNKILPMVHPDDIVLGGWDISSLSLDQAMERACVIDIDLQRNVAPLMRDMRPLPAIFDPAFVAENQSTRADNTIKGTKQQQIDQIRKDLKEFKEKNKLDKVVVMWTANTERYSEVGEFNSTKEKLYEAIAANHKEVSPSTLYAVACIEEGVPFINGSPQNTFVPGIE